MKLAFKDITAEAVRRFPDSPSRQQDFISSYCGLQAKEKRRGIGKAKNYGAGRRRHAI